MFNGFLLTGAGIIQRRLQDEGTSYREVLDDVREVMARKYLSESELPLLDVALLLGYSDATAFHRAFKRWTGVTPGEFRRKLAS